MTRADELAAARGLAESRSKARALIEEGKLLCGGKPVDKPSRKLPDDAELSVVADAQTLKFVSRAGLKLEGFLDAFGMDLRGAEILDAGASTGGFTDCALSRGAACSYCVDVGAGQLHPKLLADPRVRNFEKPTFATCPPNFSTANSLTLFAPTSRSFRRKGFRQAHDGPQTVWNCRMPREAAVRNVAVGNAQKQGRSARRRPQETGSRKNQKARFRQFPRTPNSIGECESKIKGRRRQP